MTRQDADGDYRGHLTIPELTREQGVELLAWLNEETDLGPVMSGPGPGGLAAVFTVSIQAADRATAARMLVLALTMALSKAGLAHLYPTRLELEVDC